MTEFQPTNDLEEAMVAARTDPSSETTFKKTLFNSEVLVPKDGPPPPTDRLMTARGGSSIELTVIQGGDRSFVPVFSSMEQLLKFVPPGAGYMQMLMSDLVKIWPADCWMAINPKGDLGTALSPEQVKALSGAGQILLGMPREEPEALLRTVTLFAERTPEIKACYRAQTKQPGEPSMVSIGLELDDGSDRDQIFARLTEAGRESGVAAMAMVLVDRKAPGTVARFMLEETEPFYIRQ